MTHAQPSAAAMTTSAGSIRDFADWLPPMLVKELRQGLRANVFVWSFVALQAAMILLLGLRLTARDGSDVLSDELDQYQWMAIGAALVVLLPLRGVTAISEESRQQTLDLVQLTHMSSLRLVFGKWLALVSQTLLLVTALLPYQVLYYFVGGVDVVMNLQVLGWLVLASLLLTALCLAVSPASMLVRMVVLGPIGFFCFGLYMEMSRHSYGSGPGGLIFGCFGCVYTLFVLVVAAARISRPVENAPAKIRVVALATLVTALVGAWNSNLTSAPAWFVFGLPVMIWAGLEAMTERASTLPSVYLPWVRLGWAGRCLGRLLYPGWGTGLIFVLLMTTALACGCSLMQQHQHLPVVVGSPPLAMFHLGMAILFPGVVLSLLLPHRQQRHWIYVFVQVVCVLWFLEGSVLDFKSSYGKGMFFGGNPTSAFLWTNSQPGLSLRVPISNWQGIQLMSLTMDAAMLILLFIRSRSEFRTIQEGERQALLILKSAGNPSPVDAEAVPA
ncbi:MAG: hypothetical protein JWO08_4335 [Verrucomicrobiaceae bacterium]|nr:hypothetical protein [Verrucomicrobiaceae bacterium]